MYFAHLKPLFYEPKVLTMIKCIIQVNEMLLYAWTHFTYTLSMLEDECIL